ncbi:MAG TPA: phage tail protein [Candidatus Eremiobacteraceae bacterium]|nr:phage tail protein [Candidatus Eremiobacteraceae bacterium]
MVAALTVVVSLIVFAANSAGTAHPPAPSPTPIHTGDVALPSWRAPSNFTVRAQGLKLEGVTGITAVYRSSGLVSSQHVPDHPRYETVTLKRGLTSNTQFADWHASAASKTLTIATKLPNGVTRTYKFAGCRPTKYTGPTLSPASPGSQAPGDVAIEELTLSCESITLEK